MKRRYLVAALLALAVAVVVGVTYAHRGTPTGTQSAQPAVSNPAAQNGYAYGYATWYVATRRVVPPNWGNAVSWYAYAQRDGYKVGTTPKKGAIAWTDAGPYGNVAYVEDVSTEGKTMVITAMNHNGKWNRVLRLIVPTGSFKGYIY